MQQYLSAKLGGLAAALVVTTALVPKPATAASCESLQATSFPGFSVTSATAEVAGFSAPGSTSTISVPFCRVVAVATPVEGSKINFEVWLPPASTWNQKFRGEGSGGSAGSINYRAMVDGLTRGYASMANDNGHTGSSWTFSQNPQAVVDFGYRAQHVTTVDGKLIAQAYYGTSPRHSYFVGCSQGGHHAQMEAQRYPDDYDGIIAGDPASDWTGQMLAEAWIGLASTAGGTDLPQTKLNLVTKAVLAQCAGQDGGLPTDQFLTDPRDCHFDPAVLRCNSGQDPSTCLTAPELQAVQKIYRGPRDTITGQEIAPGLAVGSEAYWRQVLVGTSLPGGSSTSFFRDGVFDNPNYDFLTFNFGSDVALTNDKAFAGQTLAQILNANDTDLDPFRQAGGKIIMYHGWADPFIPAQFSIDIYAGIIEHDAAAARLPFDLGSLLNASSRSGLDGLLGRGGQIRRALDRLVNEAALRHTQSFARLFMVPGMNHCAGGPGPNMFGGAAQPAGSPLDRTHDMVEALDAWVDRGIPPARIIATKYNSDTPSQGVAFTRPLCAYPRMAVYKGSGDQANAANYACIADEPDNNGRRLLQLNSYPNGSP
jgi:feruloyl esterase